MDVGNKIIVMGIIFLITIGTGIWLSNLGRPYNTVSFTIHKLIALGLVVYMVMTGLELLKGYKGEGSFILIIIIIVSLLALFISGALLSTETTPYIITKKIHITATVTAVVTTSGLIYTLLKSMRI